MQQGAIHRKQRCCKKHVPQYMMPSMFWNAPSPTAIGSSASSRGTGCGVAVANRRGSSEAARPRDAELAACSRVTRSGAERSNAAVPQRLCGQREVFKGLVKIPSLKYQVAYSTLASWFQPVCQPRCNAVSGVQGDGIGAEAVEFKPLSSPAVHSLARDWPQRSEHEEVRRPCNHTRHSRT